uniref:Uncharacterized protein n=1 Tax=Oryza nivara TaxID=4536 RepID=A0A0E0IL43_ORYNI
MVGWMRQPRCGGSRTRVDAMAPRWENRLDTAAPGKLRCNHDAAEWKRSGQHRRTPYWPSGRSLARAPHFH